MEPRDDTSLDHLPQQVREMAEHSRRIKEDILRQQQPTEDADEPESKETTADVDVKTAPGGTGERPAQEMSASDADGWKRKHDALYGRYSSEIGQARKTIKDLEAEVADIKAKLKAADVKPSGDESAQGESLNPKDFEDYDDGLRKLADVVSRLEKESRQKDQTIDDLRQKMQQQVEQKLAPLAHDVFASKYERFLTSLAGKVDRLGEINTDPDFVAWLSAPNPYDPNGGNLGDTLRAAESRLDVGACAKIFNDFKEQSDKYSAPKAQSAQPRPKNVQPGSSPAPTAQPDKGKRVWTSREIDKFYLDITQGRYAGREEEVRAIKAEIFQANRENRVV